MHTCSSSSSITLFHIIATPHNYTLQILQPYCTASTYSLTSHPQSHTPSASHTLTELQGLTLSTPSLVNSLIRGYPSLRAALRRPWAMTSLWHSWATEHSRIENENDSVSDINGLRNWFCLRNLNNLIVLTFEEIVDEAIKWHNVPSRAMLHIERAHGCYKQ